MKSFTHQTITKFIFRASFIFLMSSEALYGSDAFPLQSTAPQEVQPAANNKVVLDKTIAVIYHPEEIVVISTSDLRPGLDGASKTFNQVLLEKLMVLDAKMLKITVTEEDVDKQLATVQKEHNLSRADVLAIFKQAGLSVAQARADLRDQQMIQTIIDARTRSKTAVSAKELEEYCTANPIEQPGSITFSFAFVPFEHYKSKTAQREELQKAIQSGAIAETAFWMDPMTLNIQELPADKVFLKELTPGTVVQVQENAEGTQLLKLVDKIADTVVPFKDREREVMMQFRMERRAKAIEEYHQDLLKKARIKYIDQEYAPKEIKTPTEVAQEATAAAA